MFKRIPIIASRVAGWVLIAVAVSWLFYCAIHGGYFILGVDTEINLRDPFLIVTRTLGLMLLGLAFLGKGNALSGFFAFVGNKKGMLWAWAVVGAIFAALSLVRHFLFSDSALDPAIFQSYLHHLATKGTTRIFVNKPMSLLGDHLFFTLIPFSLPYKMGGINLTILIYKLCLSCVVPLSYLLGKDLELSPEKRGLFVTLASLAPSFLQTAIGDFHPENMIYIAGLGILWAFHGKRWILFAIFSLLLILTREDCGLVLGFMGFYFLLSSRNWKWVLLIICGIGVSFALMYWQSTLPLYASERLETRYGIRSFLDLAGIVKLLIRVIHPKALLALAFLMLGFGFLPFLSWRGMVSSYIAAVPNLASAYFRQSQLRAYYGNMVYPIILASVAESIKKIGGKGFQIHAIIALSFALLLGPRWLKHRFDPTYITSAYSAINMVPKNATVASTPALANSIPPRDTLYIIKTFNDLEVFSAPYVLIEETDVYYHQHWQRALEYLKEKGYKEAFSGGGVHLLIRSQNP